MGSASAALGDSPESELGGEIGDISAIAVHSDPAARGEGNGVISTSWSSPGEERAEDGEREPPVYCTAVSAALTLDVRTGRLVFEGMGRRFISTAASLAAGREGRLDSGT